MARIVTISASPSTGSRTEVVLDHLRPRLTEAGHHIVPLVLRDLPARALLGADITDPEIALALEAIASADAVVVTSPVYKAAYSGVLKTFLDLLPQDALAGKQVLPLVSGGSPAHVLVVDYALRPVLESLGADHIASGRFVLSSAIVKPDEDQPGHLEPSAATEVDRVVADFLESLHARLAWRGSEDKTTASPSPRPTPPASEPRVVFVGAGPRTLGVLERLAASLQKETRLRVDIVDPQDPGAGRIWRSDQSGLLWMNSHASDITVFTDDTVECTAPVRPGPSLGEWITGEGRSRLVEQGWIAPDEVPDPHAFWPRPVLGEYLSWAWRRVIDQLPTGVEVTVHTDRVVEVLDQAESQVVVLADGTRLVADVTVLAQGHLDQRLTDSQQEFLDDARAVGLTYVPPGYTADLELGDLHPGETVIARGMGLAFIDLITLLTSGRGGRFVGSGNDLTYLPSGREPVVYAGSRRGVPYHAKLGYALGSGPVALRHLRADNLPSAGPLDFDTQLWPLIVAELTEAHYRELFTAHPDRVRGTLEELLAALDTRPESSEPLTAQARNPLSTKDSRFSELVAHLVPDPRDRFDLASVDRPLAWTSSQESAAEALDVEQAVITHIRDDLARRRDRRFSPDRAVFDAFVSIHGFLAGLLAEGRLDATDRITRIEDGWRGLFSFVCSGPPPRRLAELLALQKAGLVHFLGPDVSVSLTNDEFVAGGPGGHQVRATALVDAFLAPVDVHRSADAVIDSLLRRGELATERPRSSTGEKLPGGLLRTDSSARALRRDGTVHTRRFLVGPSVSGSAGSGGLARPGFNAPALRQNDRLAHDVLTALGVQPGQPEAGQHETGQHHSERGRTPEQEAAA